jgi:hypothetical protein
MRLKPSWTLPQRKNVQKPLASGTCANHASRKIVKNLGVYVVGLDHASRASYGLLASATGAIEENVRGVRPQACKNLIAIEVFFITEM